MASPADAHDAHDARLAWGLGERPVQLMLIMLLMLAWLRALGTASPADAHDARLAWGLGNGLPSRCS